MPEVTSSLGRITTGEHGQIRIGQRVLDVDITDISENYETALKATAKPYEIKLEESAKYISALNDFKTKLASIQSVAGDLANRLPSYSSKYGTDTSDSVYNLRTLQLATSNPAVTPNSVAAITINDGANLGSFNLVVNQIASGDIIKGAISSPDLSTTALGLTGTLNLGTVLPGSVQQVGITAGMTLSQIQTQINSFTGTTGVAAEIALVTPGTYELRLKSTTAGTPIVYSDNEAGATVAALGLTRTPSGTMAGFINTTNATTALNLNGSITLNSSLTGVPSTIAINNAMSLSSIVSAINGATGTTNITADYDFITTSNGTSIYQLRLRSTVNGETVVASDAGGIMNAFSLNKPITDYNTVCAQFTCDGTSYKRTSNFVTDVLSGVNMQLVSQSPSTTITGTVSADNSAVQQRFLDLMTAYNQINDFYLAQTKFNVGNEDDDKTKKKDDSAILFGDPVLKQVREDLRLFFTKVIAGAPATGNSMLSMGVELDEKSYLRIINKNGINGQTLMNQFFQQPTSVLQKVFGNTYTSTNTNYTVNDLPEQLPASVAGQSFVVNCSKGGGGLVSATITLGAAVYVATISNPSSSYTQVLGPVGSPFEGVTLSINVPMNIGDSQASTMTISQGYASLVDNAMTNALIGNPQGNPNFKDANGKPLPIPGQVDARISDITQKEKNYQKSITKIEETAKKKGEDVRKQIERIMPFLEQFKQLDRMLDSLSEQMRKE